MRKKIFIILAVITLTIRTAVAQGTWVTASSNGADVRFGPASCMLDGKIFVLGGDEDVNFQGWTDTVQMFDPTSGGWSDAPNMPTPRELFGIGVINGKIYAVGGSQDTSLAVLEVFDASTHLWTSGPPMPTARYGCAASVINGKLYVVGGYHDSGSHYSVLHTLEIFDPLSNAWSTGPPMPTANALLTSSAVNNKLYVIGGYWGQNVVEIFDPSTNTWSSGPSMPTPRYLLSSCVLNNKIYVIGGNNTSYDLRTVEVFDPAVGDWSACTDMPTGREGVCCSVFNGQIYVFGGMATCCGSLNTNEVFTPGVSGVNVGNASTQFFLLQSYPNPFSQSTQISFTSVSAGYADISIVNLLGAEVARLFSGELSAGEYSLEWDASGAAAGMYECVVRENGNVQRVPLSVVR